MVDAAQSSRPSSPADNGHKSGGDPEGCFLVRPANVVRLSSPDGLQWISHRQKLIRDGDDLEAS